MYRDPSTGSPRWLRSDSRGHLPKFSNPLARTEVTEDSLPEQKYSTSKSRYLYCYSFLGAFYWGSRYSCAPILYTIIVDCLIIGDFIELIILAFTPKYYSKLTIISFVVYEFFLYSTRVSLWYSMNCDWKFGRNLEIAVRQIDEGAVRLNKYYTALFLILFIPICGACAQPFLFYYFSSSPNHWAHLRCMFLNAFSLFFVNFGFLLWSLIVYILCSFHVQYLNNLLDMTGDMMPIEDPEIIFNQYKGILDRIRGTRENISLGVNCRALFGIAVIIFTVTFYVSQNPADKIDMHVAHQAAVDFTTLVFLCSLAIEHYGLRKINYLCEQVEWVLCTFSHEPEFKPSELLINVKILGYRIRSDNYMFVLGFKVDHMMVWLAPIATFIIGYIKLEQIFKVNNI